MKIEIVRNCTPDIAEYVWRASRHQDADVSGVAMIDAPVMDFPILTLAIECTIAEREVFVSYRDHVMWARTSRVDDPLLFEVDSSFHAARYERNRQMMQENKDNGMKQDDYRMLLPMVAMTSFTLQVSIRTLSKMFLTFVQLYRETTEGIFGMAAEKIADVLSDAGYVAGQISAYADVMPLLKAEGSGRIGDMLTIYLPNAPIALRAQVIRHRSLHVKDSLRTALAGLRNLTIGSPIAMSVSADVSVWEGIASKRQCWLAQHDLWKPLLDQAGKFLDLSRKLPCSGGRCPYEADAVLRYSDKDPNPPCPMHAAITKTPFREHIVDASQMVQRDSRPLWWNMIIKNAGENV